eukprot:TRINITY_DN4935_c0_g1_i2.p1 TRINITY_DN4935_c0_g1~~TRINITY_DN4935_c0_g1_i2.p1  ORF type:complete len:408 (+),score=89.84 TRINITY_DN4935_c0_g1_i2:149-1372(+)
MPATTKTAAVAAGTLLLMVAIYTVTSHINHLSATSQELHQRIARIEGSEHGPEGIKQHINILHAKIDDGISEERMRQVVQKFHGSDCVVNPPLYYEDTGLTKPECPPEHGYDAVTIPRLSFPQAAYMLNLPGHWDDYSVRRDHLMSFGFRLQRFVAAEGAKLFAKEYAERTVKGKTVLELRDARYPGSRPLLPGEEGYLTMGERGYLASMSNLFKQALEDKSVKTILVMDDDALLHCDFNKELERVLSDTRCGSLAAHNGMGGVLLLGSAVWIKGDFPNRTKWVGGWNQAEDDMAKIAKRTGRPTQCFNVDRKTMGSFGVLYHRNTFQMIADWADAAREPFDHLWPYLTSRGVPVRAAYTSLIIQDVRHQSSVDPNRKGQENFMERAEKHRWDMTKFCDPKTRQPVV